MIGDLRVKLGPVTVGDAPNALAPGVIRVDRDGRAGRHRLAAGACSARSSRPARSR